MNQNDTNADGDGTSINPDDYQTIADVAIACGSDDDLVSYLRLVGILADPEISGCGTKGAELRFGSSVPSVVINRMSDFGIECDSLYADSDGRVIFSVLVDDSKGGGN